MTPKTRRKWLWAWLLLLIALLLAALIWLVGRYEQSRFEDQLALTANNLAGDIHAKLSRNAQRLQVLTDRETSAWSWTALQLLEQQPEILRVELRDNKLRLESSANTPFFKHASDQGIYSNLNRDNFQTEITRACALAAKSLEPAYSTSYFVPQGDGTGYEAMDMCLPRLENNQVTGYLVAAYSLDGILKEWGEFSVKQQEEISFIEADGTRLAAVGHTTRLGDRFAVKTVVDLPGITLILHLESWLSAPYWLSNTPTALVLVLVLALTAVLWLLFWDMRKRMRAEAQLAREIMQQRKAEEISRQSLDRLQKSARLATLGEMASMLSHELNQPLAAIASYASGGLNLLETESNTTTIEVKTALERIAAQSARAGQVIKSVQDFVRRSDAERIPVAPQALFDAVLPMLNLQAKQLNIRLVLEIEPHLPNVWCDKTLIEQVIINLARNGMQAMDLTSTQERVLTLFAFVCDATHIKFQVRDQGSGLSTEISTRLFTPFFTTKPDGMGLGLSLCRTVIEQHGDSLNYTTVTQPPQTGTTFSFKLPTHHATTA